MSVSNSPAEKAWRRLNKEAKREYPANLPHGGVIVTRQLVQQHRYRRTHGLPFSRNIANVRIDPAIRFAPSPLPMAAFMLAALALA